MADELKPCVDSSRDGNGRPGSGIIFPAVDKLLRAVSALMDACDDTGADRRFALSLVTRRENELISAAAKHDAKVAALRAEVERLRAENAKALRAWDDGAAIRTKENDALRAEVAVLREQRDHKFKQFLDWRGIEVGEQCDRCQGAGSYMYSSTATWMGGIGGQAMTVGVCDKCWGSGKKNKPWTNLRAVMSMRDEIAALKARLAKYTEPLTEE